MDLESINQVLLKRKSPATHRIISNAEMFLKEEGYQFQKALGVSQCGAVMLAQKTKKFKISQVRIKIIITSNDAERIACLREAEQSMQVKSQFAAKIIDYFDDFQNSCVYVISEYLEGVCLNDYLQMNEKIEEKDIAVIVKGILKGVMALKQKQVIHGGIKPSNILILPNKTAVLIDYDVTWRILNRITQEALIGNKTDSASEYVKTQEILEIIDEDCLFWPMEQWKEGLAVTESDIYATGMIIYYLCGGRDEKEMAAMRQGIFPPFNEKSNIKLLRLAYWMMKVDPKMRALPDTIITKVSVMIAPLQERYTTINYKGGDSYYGQLQNGLKHGNGRYKKKNGTIYEGEWQNDMKNGYGKMFYNEGEEKRNRYEGDFQDDLKHGRGIYTFHNGKKYFGDFECDVFDGYGILYNSKKERYEGHFKQSKFNGQGRYYYRNKDIYTGTFKDGLPQGRGTLQFKNGDIYDGQFKAGNRHGRGILTFVNGDVYEGDFTDNQQSGYGEQFYPSGSRFFGTFSNNTREHGTLMKIRRVGHNLGNHRYTIQTGRWMNGNLIPDKNN